MGSSEAPRDRQAPGTLSLHGKCMQTHFQWPPLQTSGWETPWARASLLPLPAPSPGQDEGRMPCRWEGGRSETPGLTRGIFSHCLRLAPHAGSWVLPPPTGSPEHPFPGSNNQQHLQMLPSVPRGQNFHGLRTTGSSLTHLCTHLSCQALVLPAYW